MEAQTETNAEEKPEASSADEGGGTRAFGLARWVHLGFVIIGLVLIFLLDRVITSIWDKFAEPNAGLSVAAATILATVATVALYRAPAVNRLTWEVVTELSKVTWPTWEETKVATVVVIITSLVAAAILGFFDVIVSAVTDLIYKVKV